MNIPSYDSWLIGRLLAHDDHAPEQLDVVSDRWKPMAKGLAAKPLSDRVDAFGVMLAALPKDEAEALEQAIDEADSDGEPPQPEATAEAADSWGPLRIGEPPSAEAFPIEVFPLPVATFCKEVAESSLCPIDFIGTAMLVTAGAAIGQSVNIEIKRGWYEAPLLYAVTVGTPGRAKTPAIRAATRPLVDIDKRLREESKLARESWEAAKKAHAKDDTKPPPGPEPPQLRAIVKDITRESLCIVLADNPRGLLCSPDEATAWVNSWNQYKAKGTDEQFWLSLYSGDPVSVDRKGGRESLHVPHPFCGLIGGIQPDFLGSLRDDSGRDNGLLDRIVFSYPEKFPVRQWTDRELSPDAERDWSNAIDRLASTTMRLVKDDMRPWLAALTRDAKVRFVSWFNANGREIDEPGSHAGALSKSEARLARIALILSRLRLACVPDQVLQDVNGVPPVTLPDIEGAIRLTAYFASHLDRVAHRMSSGAGDPNALALLKWIKRKRLMVFRESEPSEDLRCFRSSPKLLEAAILSLTSLGAIRHKEQPPIAGKPGRKPSTTHEVNPEVFRSASLSGISA